MNLSEPTFEWRGLDYEYGLFTYTGNIQFTKKNTMFKKPKQVWKGDCKIMMLYKLLDQSWETGFEWVGIPR